MFGETLLLLSCFISLFVHVSPYIYVKYSAPKYIRAEAQPGCIVARSGLWIAIRFRLPCQPASDYLSVISRESVLVSFGRGVHLKRDSLDTHTRSAARKYACMAACKHARPSVHLHKHMVAHGHACTAARKIELNLCKLVVTVFAGTSQQ